MSERLDFKGFTFSESRMAAGGGDGAAHGRGAPVPVWVDCDPGHDDFFMLLLVGGLVKKGVVELVGVSTTYGNVGIEQTTLNARRALWLVGLDHVPVIRGAPAPFARTLKICEEIHGDSGLDGYHFPDLPSDFPAALRAGLDGGEGSLASASVGIASLIRRHHASSGAKVVLIATGAMTNTALLLASCPDVKSSIASISWMGGAVGGGNMSPSAEFNAELDPEALAAVFERSRGVWASETPSAALPLRIAPLELTHTILATPAVLGRMREIGGGKCPRLGYMLESLATFFRDSYRGTFGFDSPPVHDPMAVIQVVAPHLITKKVRCACVVDCGLSPWTSGGTILDIFHMGPAKGDPASFSAEVSLAADVPRVWDFILDAFDAFAPEAEARLTFAGAEEKPTD
jgi:inosine-uridine nucleoside N-ribohydrolase